MSSYFDWSEHVPDLPLMSLKIGAKRFRWKVKNPEIFLRCYSRFAWFLRHAALVRASTAVCSKHAANDFVFAFKFLI